MAFLRYLRELLIGELLRGLYAAVTLIGVGLGLWGLLSRNTAIGFFGLAIAVLGQLFVTWLVWRRNRSGGDSDAYGRAEWSRTLADIEQAGLKRERRGR